MRALCLAVSGLLFSVVAIAHACRLVLGWHISVDGIAVPLRVSWPGFIVPGLLALWAFALYGRAD